jgi:magnesium-protoporphyrin O-methyltransferase
MQAMTYEKRRGELEQYFDRTAAAAWAKLTSDAPVSGIRANVRAGRDEMRATLLSYLPQDLRGRRVLDAGCGTGALAVEAARRGADVVASDLSATLVGLARERLPKDLGDGSISFHVGDMTDATLGEFDHVVAMDSIIHYRGPDMVRVVSGLASRARVSVIFTFAPLTPLLAVALTVGKIVPRGDKSPAIEPIRKSNLWKRIARHEALADWTPARSYRVERGFYTSNAVELVRI